MVGTIFPLLNVTCVGNETYRRELYWHMVLTVKVIAGMEHQQHPGGNKLSRRMRRIAMQTTNARLRLQKTKKLDDGNLLPL